MLSTINVILFSNHMTTELVTNSFHDAEQLNGRQSSTSPAGCKILGPFTLHHRLLGSPSPHSVAMWQRWSKELHCAIRLPQQTMPSAEELRRIWLQHTNSNEVTSTKLETFYVENMTMFCLKTSVLCSTYRLFYKHCGRMFSESQIFLLQETFTSSIAAPFNYLPSAPHLRILSRISFQIYLQLTQQGTGPQPS